MKVMFLVSAFLILFPLTILNANEGDLDPTFGAAGRVTTDFGSRFEGAIDISVQADGKIVAIGTTGVYPERDIAVARYLPYGSLDSSFGNGGKTTIGSSLSDSQARALVIQPDGKIVIAGFTRIWWVGTGFLLVRLNPNGSLDNTFSGDGKVFDSNGWLGATDLAIQADGKLVAVGPTQSPSTDYDFRLIRYNSNGSHDTSFGINGSVTTDFGGLDDYASAVVIQNDGKILVIGTSEDSNGQVNFAAARYNSDGSLDASFGNNGRVTTVFGSSSQNAVNAVLQSDGKIILQGAMWNPNDEGVNGFALARYNSDGTLDTTFGSSGKATINISSNDAPETLAIQPDGKILIGGGAAFNPQQEDFLLARLDSAGTLDLSFGNGGYVTTDFSDSNYDCGYAIAIQADGKIVFAGVNSRNGSNDFAVARYLGTSGACTYPESLLTNGIPINDSIPCETSQSGWKYYSFIAGLGSSNLTVDLNNLSADANLYVRYGAKPDLSSYDCRPYLGGTTPEQCSVATPIAGTWWVGINNLDSGTINYTISAIWTGPGGLFFDDFSDGILATDWNYIKPLWSESTGFLVGTPTKKAAFAIADPAYSGCGNCTVQATIRSQGGIGNRVWLLGWYQNQQHTIELLMRQDTGRWILKQRQGGRVVAKEKAIGTIDAGVDYVATITFNGSSFQVAINGNQIITMRAVGNPFGTVGFRSKNTAALFDYVSVY